MKDLQFSRYLKFQKLSGDCYEERLDRAATEIGLTRPEASVLLFFYNNPPYDTAADAARYRGFSKAYLSKAVERLLGKGLLRIEPDEKDRRLQHIRLTPAGEATGARLREVQHHFWEAMLAGIGEEEQQAMHTILAKIEENMRRMRGE